MTATKMEEKRFWLIKSLYVDFIEIACLKISPNANPVPRIVQDG